MTTEQVESYIREKKVVLLVPSWPSSSTGQGIAVHSLIQVCLDVYARVYVVCISEKPYAGSQDRVEYVHVQVASEPQWRRFAKSMFSTWPAVTVRYRAAKEDVLTRIAQIVGGCRERGCELSVIAEDLPIASLLPDLTELYPDIPVAIRSNNLLTAAFARLRVEGPLLMRLLWVLEVAKMRRFEKKMAQEADRFWAITHAEAKAYADLLNVHPDGVIGVVLDAEHYAAVSPGDAKTVVHVGTADLRKGKGLREFVHHIWPRVREQVPDARLELAGRGTERFAHPELGISAHGFVDDDREILSKGLLFVNPQWIGAGLQLKNVVAMLAGKTVITSTVCADGLAGRNGDHFIASGSEDEMASRIIHYMEALEEAGDIARQGRSLASSTYSRARFLSESRSLIIDFARSTRKA